jgi:hypothetical protein
MQYRKLPAKRKSKNLLKMTKRRKNAGVDPSLLTVENSLAGGAPESDQARCHLGRDKKTCSHMIPAGGFMWLQAVWTAVRVIASGD